MSDIVVSWIPRSDVITGDVAEGPSQSWLPYRGVQGCPVGEGALTAVPVEDCGLEGQCLSQDPAGRARI